MGDRYWLQLNCAGCGEKNPPTDDNLLEDGVYYAPSSGYMSFACHKCEKTNWIENTFTTKIVNEKEEKKLYKLNGFE